MILKQDYINAINEEIDWCKNNPDKSMVYDDSTKNIIYQEAFIKGLEQAKILIENISILH